MNEIWMAVVDNDQVFVCECLPNSKYRVHYELTTFDTRDDEKSAMKPKKRIEYFKENLNTYLKNAHNFSLEEAEAAKAIGNG